MSGETRLRTVLPTALLLALGPAITLGLARFSYALVLPGMRGDLHWSYTQAGAVNTVNAVGYLLGAVVAAPVTNRFGARRAYTWGLAVTGVALVATGATGTYPVILTCRLVAGIASAIAFVAGAALVTVVGSRAPRHAATLVTSYLGVGAGAGIVASGLLIGPLGLGWRADWWLLGGLTLLAVGIAAPVAYRCQQPPRRADGARRAPLRVILPSTVAYGLGGFGYIAYMTFIVAFLTAHGAGAGRITTFWVVLGVAAAVSAFGWGPLLHRLPPGPGIALVLAMLTAGAALPLLGTGTAVTMVSAVLFGASSIATASAVTATARRLLPPYAWTGAIGVLTVVFSAGQSLGPVVSGTLSDLGGVPLGLGVSAAVLTLAALVVLAQRSRPADVPATVPACRAPGGRPEPGMTGRYRSVGIGPRLRT